MCLPQVTGCDRCHIRQHRSHYTQRSGLVSRSKNARHRAHIAGYLGTAALSPPAPFTLHVQKTRSITSPRSRRRKRNNKSNISEDWARWFSLPPSQAGNTRASRACIRACNIARLTLYSAFIIILYSRHYCIFLLFLSTLCILIPDYKRSEAFPASETIDRLV